MFFACVLGQPIETEYCSSSLLRLVCTRDFRYNFCRALQCSFVANVNYWRFHCDFCAIRVGIVQKKKQRQIPYRNRTEVAVSLHLRFSLRARTRQELH